ncbi:MAG: 50S ribosomal protein L19 [Candidatus Colwellbacteria bacterium]|jgi:large subunit ribosomal protein L19|nr:50S ribosomal protein L19 [Candidatus Colwellbacteria bacterium]MCK9497622.1 50S ribosomal protein L19 [Candidatus Colwellbacteria bacterium]MDD3752488.1 50S ribosomal protein L19 [Candidatus Colwellbacteria bacterium]
MDKETMDPSRSKLDEADKIKTGTKVKVYEKIKEGDKQRTGFFEGIVIARKHGSEKGATFTVRGKLGEHGLEKTYPIHSPLIEKVDIISKPKKKVKRSKLYYIRDLSAKRIKEKIGQKV